MKNVNSDPCAAHRLLYQRHFGIAALANEKPRHWPGLLACGITSEQQSRAGLLPQWNL